MSDDQGFTVAEALTALLIVSIAMVGLTQATYLVGLQARRADATRAQTDDLAHLQRLMASAPPDLGPFSARGERFGGDTRQAQFDCGQPAPCTLRLSANRLLASWSARSVSAPVSPEAALNYVDDTGAVSARWPEGHGDHRLAAIAIVQDQFPLAVLRFPVTTSGACLAGGRGCGREERSENVQAP